MPPCQPLTCRIAPTPTYARSVHEVYIDEEQVAWFERLLAANPGRPVVVFTHAPPMGCGLKVVQNVHVKNRWGAVCGPAGGLWVVQGPPLTADCRDGCFSNALSPTHRPSLCLRLLLPHPRCAWLNHSESPSRFIKLVEAHPNIRLWFSGHFHLSQNYPDSISVVNQCAFVQTGVIGECNRDGNRWAGRQCKEGMGSGGRVRRGVGGGQSSPASHSSTCSGNHGCCSSWYDSYQLPAVGHSDGRARAHKNIV